MDIPMDIRNVLYKYINFRSVGIDNDEAIDVFYQFGIEYVKNKLLKYNQNINKIIHIYQVNVINIEQVKNTMNKVYSLLNV